MSKSSVQISSSPKKTAPGTPAAQNKQTSAGWSANFSKRLPHRIGEPLSSGGGGDGIVQ